MNRDEIIAKVKALRLPAGQFIIFGSCPLAAAELRLAKDIDMLVSQSLLRQLAAAGWQQVDKGPDDKPYTFDVFEAHDSWSFSSYSPTLKELLSRADYYDGVPFASLGDVRKWKQVSGRPKDLADIALIDAVSNSPQ